jgi:hypothetical protein
VLSVAVHPSGNAFVTGSSDSKVRLFDLQQRQCTQTVAEHSDQVPDAPELFCASCVICQGWSAAKVLNCELCTDILCAICRFGAWHSEKMEHGLHPCQMTNQCCYTILWRSDTGFALHCSVITCHHERKLVRVEV